MGILNVTPDSFAERTRFLDPEAAVDAALRMQQDGADLVDVGGESTRPGADPIPAAEELARIMPVLRALAGRLTIPVSVDTSKADVARAAVDAGAAIINDVSGLRFDPPVADVVARSGAAIVLMHTRGMPKTMYAEAVYEDVIADVRRELTESIAVATAAGVPVERLIVCPSSRQRWTVLCSSVRRASRSCGPRSAIGRRPNAIGEPQLRLPPRFSPAPTSSACTPLQR